MIRLLVLALSFIALAIPAPAAPLARVALLIGNDTYLAAGRLQNPTNDIALLKKTLEEAGFDTVQTAINLDRQAMIATLRKFEPVASAADIAIVYFSGHGIEARGRNFLIPTDAHLATERDLEDEAVSLERIESAIEGAHRLRLIILDACRNNPFEATMRRPLASKDVTRGLSRVEPETADTLIAFAAKAGTTALDGGGSNSPFAAALSRHLVEPGLDIRIAFGRVRDDVLGATGRQQEPFVYGSLGGSELFLRAAVTPARPRPEIGGSVELAVWTAIKNTSSPAPLNEFLRNYPDGAYRAAALDRLAYLENPAKYFRKIDEQEMTEEDRRRVTRTLIRQNLLTGPLPQPAGYTLSQSFIYGSVRTWQEKNGELVTGFLTREQIDRLKAEGEEPLPIETFSAINADVDVRRRLYRSLVKLGFAPREQANYIFETQKPAIDAVKAYQSSIGVEPTGFLNKEQADRLLKIKAPAQVKEIEDKAYDYFNHYGSIYVK